MRLVAVLITAGVVGSLGCAARAPYTDAQAAAWEKARRAALDSVAASHRLRFAWARSPERGDAASVMPLGAEQQAAIYRLLVTPVPARGGAGDTSTGRTLVEARPWVEAYRLIHEGGYSRSQPLADSVLRALIETGQFQGACGAAPWRACPQAGPVRYVFSAIYQISPGVMRVFAVRATTYAQEKMYRVEQRGSGWVVTDETTVMIE